MRIHILSLFPGMFEPVLGESIVGRAAEKELLTLEYLNIRDFSNDKHNKTDDYPFGGGAGMVMMADPVFGALKSIDAGTKRCIYMSPRGRLLDEDLIRELATTDELVILCGHYEGMDQRVLDYWNMEEVSIGDYVLTGGEIPAMVLVDSVSRMIPGVLGNEDAHDEESIYSGLLEYPQYTKPREYEGMTVPEVLVSGNHRLIHLWKFQQSLLLTAEQRPELFHAFAENAEELDKDEIKILLEIKKRM